MGEGAGLELDRVAETVVRLDYVDQFRVIACQVTNERAGFEVNEIPDHVPQRFHKLNVLGRAKLASKLPVIEPSRGFRKIAEGSAASRKRARKRLEKKEKEVSRSRKCEACRQYPNRTKHLASGRKDRNSQDQTWVKDRAAHPPRVLQAGESQTGILAQRAPMSPPPQCGDYGFYGRRGRDRALGNAQQFHHGPSQPPESDTGKAPVRYGAAESRPERLVQILEAGVVVELTGIKLHVKRAFDGFQKVLDVSIHTRVHLRVFYSLTRVERLATDAARST